MYCLLLSETKSVNSRYIQHWFLLRAPRDTPFCVSLLASTDSWQSLAFLGLQMYHSNTCHHLHMAFSLVSLCPNYTLLLRTQVILDQSPPLWSYLNLIISEKALFPLRSHSQVPEVRLSIHLLGIHNSNHNRAIHKKIASSSHSHYLKHCTSWHLVLETYELLANVL